MLILNACTNERSDALTLRNRTLL